MTAPTLVPGALSDDEAGRAAAAAYRLASRGQVQRSAGHLEPALATLDAPAPDRAPTPAAAALSVEVLRRHGRFSDAAELSLLAAAHAPGPDVRRAFVALAAESAVLAGTIESARDRLSAFAASASVADEDLGWGRAVVDLYAGRTSEARDALRSRSPQQGDAWATTWWALFNAEALFELDAQHGLRDAMASIQWPEDLDRFSELALRRHFLEAGQALLSILAEASEGANDDGAARRRLRRYAAAFPLYAAWSTQLDGEALLARGERAEREFERAGEQAKQIGETLAARLLARQVIRERQAHERGTARRTLEARTLCLEVGAGARLGQLAGRGGGGQGALAAGAPRQSVAMRLTGTNLTESSGLDAVFEVSRHLQSIRTLDELLERILDSVVRVMKAERGALLKLQDDGALTCAAAKGIDSSKVVESTGEVSFGVIREAEATGEVVVSDNALADARFGDRRSVMATDIRSVICCPVRTADRVFGFIYLDRRLIDVPFDATHEDLLGAFCTQVAVAWQNALAFEEIESLNRGLEQRVKERTVELRSTNQQLQDSIEELTNTRLKLAEAERDALEAEMRLARQVQQSILPTDEVLRRPGVRIAGRVVPASFTGGDFWAVMSDDDGRTLILVADVTGHGVAASMITATARACLDTLTESGLPPSPGHALGSLNRVIHLAASGHLCATAFACLFDPKTRRLSYSNAGHNFPYRLGPAAPQPLIARGVRLGEEASTEYVDDAVDVVPGERLLLFSDGIVEWENEKGRAFGDRRLLKALAATGDAALPEQITAAIEAAEKFSQGIECDDDVMLVIAEFTEED